MEQPQAGGKRQVASNFTPTMTSAGHEAPLLVSPGCRAAKATGVAIARPAKPPLKERALSPWKTISMGAPPAQPIQLHG
jgi:hypothetical protein